MENEESAAEIGVIGGSGVYSLDFIEDPQRQEVDTPYGKSPEILSGKLEGRKVAFMPRHGEKHSNPPHKINYRANLWALHDLGVEKIIATTAVGSLNREIEPGEFVLLDQFLDFTKKRPLTYYDGEGGEVVHIDMTDPYCPELRKIIYNTSKEMGISLHRSGTYVCTEGPRFETRAEIEMFRKLGGNVVGMTNVPESVLARELEMCYSTISVVTNFAAGITGEKLTHDEVKEIMDKNIDRVQKLILSTIPDIPKQGTCPCGNALEGSKVEA